MPLPVEGAGVTVGVIAHHDNFLTEFDVGVEFDVRRQLGVQCGFAAIDTVTEGFPVGCRADAEGAPPPALSAPTPASSARGQARRG